MLIDEIKQKREELFGAPRTEEIFEEIKSVLFEQKDFFLLKRIKLREIPIKSISRMLNELYRTDNREEVVAARFWETLKIVCHCFNDEGVKLEISVSSAIDFYNKRDWKLFSLEASWE